MISFAIVIMAAGWVLAMIGLANKEGTDGGLPLMVGIILTVVGSVLAFLLS